jgi:hypothetical protein
MIKTSICLPILGIKGQLKATNWKSCSQITKIEEIFMLNRLFKLCIKVFQQLKFCLACTYKVRRLRTPNPWIGQDG